MLKTVVLIRHTAIRVYLASDRDLNVCRQLSLQVLVSRHSALQQLVRCHGAARRVRRHRAYDVTKLELKLLHHVNQDTLTEVDRSKSIGKRSCFHWLASL